jgi:hypothetical protein
MRKIFTLIGICLVLAAFVACDREDEQSEEGTTVMNAQAVKAPTWMDTLTGYLPALGHRNWIVVADSAFPLQISPGIETIVTNEDHFTVLAKVLKAVDGAKHIRPKIWLDKELGYVTEDLAPGADDVRRRLDEALEGRGAAPVLHEDLIARLDQAGKAFKIVMVKTTMAVPYTTVFLELDCGYWPAANEAKMREKVK